MTLSTAALSAMANACASASAAGLVNGSLDLLDAGGAILANVGLGTPTVNGNLVTMGGFPRTVNATAGTVSSARYRRSDGSAWKTGMTVGTAAGAGVQVVLSSLTIGAGQTVTVSSATLSHSAI